MTRQPPSPRDRPGQLGGRSNRDSATTAREHYRREKTRRAGEPNPDRELLEAAKREYLALLAEGVARGKGGRPKKKPAVPDDTDHSDEELDANDE